MILLRYTLAGDANLDGAANALDFNALASNYGATKASWEQGDLTADEHVDSMDFDVLATNFNRSLPEVMPATNDAQSLFGDSPVQKSDLLQLV